jgi:hypothetical protein
MEGMVRNCDERSAFIALFREKWHITIGKEVLDRW